MPMMYNPAGGAQRAGGGSPPSNSRQTNLQRIDQAAMRKRKDKRPAQGQSPALPGVPQLSVAGLPEQQQQQRQQQPMQQPSQAQQSAQQQQQWLRWGAILTGTNHGGMSSQAINLPAQTPKPCPVHQPPSPYPALLPEWALLGE